MIHLNISQQVTAWLRIDAAIRENIGRLLARQLLRDIFFLYCCFIKFIVNAVGYRCEECEKVYRHLTNLYSTGQHPIDTKIKEELVSI